MEKPGKRTDALIFVYLDYILKLCNHALIRGEKQRQDTKPNDMNLTTFEHWQRYHPNYGCFQTRLFEAYEAADDGNRKKLEEAFPFWFTAAALLDEGEVKTAPSF